MAKFQLRHLNYLIPFYHGFKDGDHRWWLYGIDVILVIAWLSIMTYILYLVVGLAVVAVVGIFAAMGKITFKKKEVGVEVETQEVPEKEELIP